MSRFDHEVDDLLDLLRNHDLRERGWRERVDRDIHDAEKSVEKEAEPADPTETPKSRSRQFRAELRIALEKTAPHEALQFGLQLLKNPKRRALPYRHVD
jgi:hypothetical protein